MNPENLWNMWNRMLQASPWEIVWGLLSSPVVCAALGVALALVVARVRRGSSTGRTVLREERVAVGAIALVVGVVWIADLVLRGYVLDMSATVSWWRFALAPIAAAAGMAIWGALLRTKVPRRTVDATSIARRTWTTFGSRPGIRILLALMAVTACVVVVFGQTSAALEPGVAAHVALDVPNVDAPPIVTVFPGWAYGIPLLAGVVALAAAVVFALHRNAVRPFSDRVRLEAQRSGRSDAARDLVTLALGVVLVALGGLLHMARSGAVTTMIVMTDSGAEARHDVSLPHADLILAGGFVAPFLQIGGCMLLALLVVRAIGLVRARPRRSASPVEVPA
ncbi:MAG: non-ribosomal peptide synthetase [Microbacterium sp.]|nr:non-ribosomal peptide synthetase [Microbacterium sp.]